MKTQNMKSFNVNHEVTVVLTDDGIKYLKNYYDEHGMSHSKALLEKSKRRTLKMQLWELMNIFGPEMYMGNTLLFKNNCIWFYEGTFEN